MEKTLHSQTEVIQGDFLLFGKKKKKRTGNKGVTGVEQ